VLSLGQDEWVRELVTDQEDDAMRRSNVKAYAAKDLEDGGREVESPSEMEPQFPDTPLVGVWGYSLRRDALN
jgi:hypothetical protein